MTKSHSVDWHEYAQLYDHLQELLPYQQYLRDITAALALDSATSLLDAGCGTGLLLKTLRAEQLRQAIAIDNSSEMLVQARSKTYSLDVQFEQQDLATVPLPYPDNSFDRIVCSNVLYTLQNPLDTLLDFRRLAAPNGLLVIVNPKPNYDNGAILKAHAGDSRPLAFWSLTAASAKEIEGLCVEALGRERADIFLKIGKINAQIQSTADFHFLSESELSVLLETAGFAVETTTTTYAEQSHLIVARNLED